MNLLKPVHASDDSVSPTTFQQSSIFSPPLHQVMYVSGNVDMHLIGIGSDSSLGTHSLTRGST